MTYDLVNGYSKLTGHVSPLYSTVEQPESTDHAVKYLDSIGVDPQKIAIGMVFYARLFKNVPPGNTGLYQEGKFSNYMAYYDFDRHLSAKAGYIMQWDNIAKAPYAYNRNTHTYATFDNSQSIIEKVRYVHEHKLGGIMFWELLDDKEPNGLLDVINKAKKEFEK